MPLDKTTRISSHCKTHPFILKRDCKTHRPSAESNVESFFSPGLPVLTFTHESYTDIARLLRWSAHKKSGFAPTFLSYEEEHPEISDEFSRFNKKGH